MTDETNNNFSASDMATAAAQGFRDGVASVRPDHVEDVRAMVPSVEQLAEALADVRCFHDLSAELIAPQLRENLARLNPAPVEQSAMVVPDGYVLVPVEPTEEMLRNGWNAYVEDLDGGFNRFAKTYRAMLSAAPTPEPASPISAQGEGGEK